MPNRIDTTMKPMKPATLDSTTNPVLVQAKGAKLVNRHGAMLSRSQLRNLDIGWDVLVAHIATKSSRPPNSPPLL